MNPLVGLWFVYTRNDTFRYQGRIVGVVDADSYLADVYDPRTGYTWAKRIIAMDALPACSFYETRAQMNYDMKAGPVSKIPTGIPDDEFKLANGSKALITTEREDLPEAEKFSAGPSPGAYSATMQR